MVPRLLGWCCLSVACLPSHAQWQTQMAQTEANFRGLCAVDRQVAWASGSKGTFLRTVDGGQTWHVGQVPGAEELDFRDVQALDGQTAWLLSIGNGSESRIYKTTDAGQRWTLQFQNQQPKAFFDALECWDAQHAIALSDPVDGRFLVITTTNGGAMWEPVKGSMPSVCPTKLALVAAGRRLAFQGGSMVGFAS